MCDDDGAACEGHLVTAPGQGTDARGLAAPLDGVAGERVEQDLPQLAALYLGACARAVVGLVEQDGPVPVEQPYRLAALQDEATELVHQAGCVEGELAVAFVDVEHSALRTGRRGGLCLVDRDREAVEVQDTGQDEPAESGADDRDRSVHGAP